MNAALFGTCLRSRYDLFWILFSGNGLVNLSRRAYCVPFPSTTEALGYAIPARAQHELMASAMLCRDCAVRVSRDEVHNTPVETFTTRSMPGRRFSLRVTLCDATRRSGDLVFAWVSRRTPLPRACRDSKCDARSTLHERAVMERLAFGASSTGPRWTWSSLRRNSVAPLVVLCRLLASSSRQIAAVSWLRRETPRFP